MTAITYTNKFTYKLFTIIFEVKDPSLAPHWFTLAQLQVNFSSTLEDNLQTCDYSCNERHKYSTDLFLHHCPLSPYCSGVPLYWRKLAYNEIIITATITQKSAKQQHKTVNELSLHQLTSCLFSSLIIPLSYSHHICQCTHAFLFTNASAFLNINKQLSIL